MKKTYVPFELRIRRELVKELYNQGFGVIDICRYFEVPTCSVKMSLKAEGVFEFEKKDVYLGPLGILGKMVMRDARIREDVCSQNRDVWKFGLWKIPGRLPIYDEWDEGDIEAQNELRQIGIRPNEIREYLGLKDGQILDASRAQKSRFFDDQLEVCAELKAKGWTIRNLMEFTGVSVNRYNNRDKEVEVRKPGLMKGYNNIQDIAEKLFEEYNSDDSVTHQMLAKKHGITRRSVITYIQQYEIKNEVTSVRKYSSGNQSKGEKSNKIKFNLDVLKTHMIESGKEWVFKDGWTIEKVAQEYGVTELTVAKNRDKLRNQ